MDSQTLRANYGKTPVEEIKQLLERIKIVTLAHGELGSKWGYYTIEQELLDKIKDKPRNISLMWKAMKPTQLFEDFTGKVNMPFYVKSVSCFIKPDIGEVFDQMSKEEKLKTKAICIEDILMPVVGEPLHSIMTATLLM